MLTSDDLSVCQSFISPKKSIQSILQPHLTANSGLWTGLDTRKDTLIHAEEEKSKKKKKKEEKLRKGKLTEDPDLRYESVPSQRSQLLLLLKVHLEE